MSILYNGDYRVIDLQEWHTWWPWVPIRLTEDWGWQMGPWRWMYAVERKLDYEGTYGQSNRDWKAGRHLSECDHNPLVWEYRDISGERYARFATPGFA